MHALHPVVPVTFWKVSSPHAAHALIPVVPAYLPSPHGAHDGVCPRTSQASPLSPFAYPASQFWHALVLTRGWYLPLSHVLHTACPLNPCDLPAAQTVHAVALVRFIAEPAGHAMHTLQPVPVRYDPVAHGWQADCATFAW